MVEELKQDWKGLMEAENITGPEFDYIFRYQYHNGGDFITSLYRAIHAADEGNLEKLARGFPGEVAAVLAWTRGDLAQRAEPYGIKG